MVNPIRFPVISSVTSVLLQVMSQLLVDDGRFGPRRVQAREGRLVAMKLLVHAFAGPVLALLADSIGRRPVLLLGHDFMGDLGTMAV